MNIVDPPISGIFESWDPYVDFFYQDHRGWILPDLDRIRALAQHHDFVLANCSTEHWGSERDFPLAARLCDLLTEHYAKDFICLCHDPADQDLQSNILFFPFFAWFKQWQPLPEPQVANAKRTFLFSNLNRNTRDFRIANYLALKNKSYAHRCLLTMHDRFTPNHDYDGHLALTQEEIQDWEQIRYQLCTEVSDGFDMVFAHMHPAFADSYLHVVSESTIKDKIFLTEKTWQPVFAGQLFVIWGNTGIVSHLRDLGVDVFDDVINHDYDSISDHRQRLDRIHQELDRLACLDWPDVYMQTTQRRQSNAGGFAEGKFIASSIDRLRLALPAGIL